MIDSVADPDPGSGAFLTPRSGIQDPGFGMDKNQDPDPGSGSGMNNQIIFPRALKTIFGVKFGVDPGSGIEKIRIRDPGWKKVGSGINIPDPQHWF